MQEEENAIGMRKGEREGLSDGEEGKHKQEKLVKIPRLTRVEALNSSVEGRTCGDAHWFAWESHCQCGCCWWPILTPANPLHRHCCSCEPSCAWLSSNGS